MMSRAALDRILGFWCSRWSVNTCIASEPSASFVQTHMQKWRVSKISSCYQAKNRHVIKVSHWPSLFGFKRMWKTTFIQDNFCTCLLALYVPWFLLVPFLISRPKLQLDLSQQFQKHLKSKQTANPWITRRPSSDKSFLVHVYYVV